LALAVVVERIQLQVQMDQIQSFHQLPQRAVEVVPRMQITVAMVDLVVADLEVLQQFVPKVMETHHQQVHLKAITAATVGQI
jgi:hypothetical protein